MVEKVPEGEPGGGRREVGGAVFRFVKQTRSRTWFWDAFFEAAGGLCLETGGCSRFSLPEKDD